MALRLHPDKCKEAGAEEAFKRVGEAFGVLSDREKRSVYDQCGVEGLKGGGGGPGGGIDPEDIFQAFFGGQGFPGGATFVQTGGRGGFQTFHFSSGGMGPGGGIHFSSGHPFMGMGGNPGLRRRQQAREQQEAEAREPEEVPQWMKVLQTFAGALGPLLPLFILAMMAIGMMVMTTLVQFFMQRAFVLLPIMYFTSGRTKMVCLSTVVVLSVLGVI